MKAIKFIGIACICLFLTSCEGEQTKSLKLTGTYWACESSIPAVETSMGHKPESYFYRVWHFTSEKEATLVRYTTSYTKVDIEHGDDPAKYGYITDDCKGTIHVTYYAYPKISTYETSDGISGKIENKNYWDGEFITNDLLVMDKTVRFLRIKR